MDNGMPSTVEAPSPDPDQHHTPTDQLLGEKRERGVRILFYFIFFPLLFLFTLARNTCCLFFFCLGCRRFNLENFFVCLFWDGSSQMVRSLGWGGYMAKQRKERGRGKRKRTSGDSKCGKKTANTPTRECSCTRGTSS